MQKNSIKYLILVIFLGLFGFKVSDLLIDDKINDGYNDVKEVNENNAQNNKQSLNNNSDEFNDGKYQEFSDFGVAIDGDSIRFKNYEVRLMGIDAPEYSQTCLNAFNQEYPCGRISKIYLANILRNQKVTCKYAKKDIYNRYLAECFVDKLNINHEIIKNGMAIIYDFNDTNPIVESLENQARINKIGVWQGAFEKPKDYRKSHKINSKKQEKK
jgi:endonuclease YncB( thermonuclease family)